VADTTGIHAVLSTDAEARTAGARVVVAVACCVGAEPAPILACFVRGGEVSELPLVSAVSDDKLFSAACLKLFSSKALSFSKCSFSISACFVGAEFSVARVQAFFLILLVCWIPSANVPSRPNSVFQIRHGALSGTPFGSSTGGHLLQSALFESNYWPQPEFCAVGARFPTKPVFLLS